MGKPVRLSVIKGIALTPFDELPKECQYDNCGKPTASRGLCKHHYSYYYKFVGKNLPKYRKKPSGLPDFDAFVGDPCSMCGEPSESLGFCAKHYARYRIQQKRAEKALND